MNGPDGEHWDGCTCEDCTPKPLPPDARDPITKVIEQLARRWGSDATPIVEARAELARLRAPAPQPDSRIEAWRALDAEERAYSTRRLAIAGRLGEVAAAALEALGERP